MTFYTEIETEIETGLDYEGIFKEVALMVLDKEECPYECSVNLLITDDAAIHEMNSEFREVDRSTDVLSFPMLEYETPGDYEGAVGDDVTCFDPDTGELALGDIVVSAEHVLAQAEAYGHSVKREFAFLIAHSMLHLSGYDHMEPEEEKVMFEKQEAVLSALGITR